MPIFMLIDGRNGGSTDPRHPGWFEISAVGFGAAAVGGQGGLARLPFFTEINVSLAGAAAALLADLAISGPIESVRIKDVDSSGAVAYDLRLAECW